MRSVSPFKNKGITIMNKKRCHVKSNRESAMVVDQNVLDVQGMAMIVLTIIHTEDVVSM